MATIKEKSVRLAMATKRVYDFVEKGGDIKSPEAVPIAVQMVERYADLAKEFGVGILRSIKKPGVGKAVESTSQTAADRD